MRGAIFAALVATAALLPAGLAAQTPDQPPAPPVQPAMPAPPAAVAPAPPAGQPADPAGQASPGRRGPANICQELTAFLQPPPPPAAVAGAPPAAQAQAQDQAKAAAAGAPQAAPAQQTAVAAPSSSAAPPTTQPSGQGAPTQSGISGPIPQANTQGTPGPQAAGQSPAVTQSQPAPQAAAPAPQAAPAPAAPAAPAGPQAPKPSPAAIEKAKAAAEGNDIAGCRSAAQEMRRAGVALPPPLIALAGLDLKYHQAAQPR